MENKQPNRAVVDVETGEELTTLNKGDRIQRANSINKYNNVLHFKSDSFSKLNATELRLILPELTANEKALLLTLFAYIKYESCSIQYNNGKGINFTNLVQISGLSKNTLRDTLNLLMDKHIIFKSNETRNAEYFVCPWLIVKGNLINKDIKKMFKDYQIRSKNNIKWGDLKE